MKRFLYTILIIAIVAVGMSFAPGIGQYMGNQPFTFGSKSVVNINDSLYVNNIVYKNGLTGWVSPGANLTRTTPGVPSAISPVEYARVLTTANGSGQVIDTLTVDGTGNGTALFPNNVYSIQATGLANDTTTQPFVYVQSVGSGNKTVTLRVAKASTGAPVAVGTTLYLTIVGN